MIAHVLLVEDNAHERKRLTTILEGATFRVTAVESLTAARGILLRANCDIAIASTMSDEGADLDLVDWLRQQLPEIVLPILVIATDSTARTRLAARSAGANDYLTRPFLEENLIHRVSNILVRRESKPSLVPPGFTRRILVVDDSPTYGFALTDALQKDGHDVAFAETGKEALTYLETNRVDAVVVDVFLPDVNGVEVCRRIKTNDRTSMLPVLVLTGREKSAMRAEAVEANADDFAVKSSDFEAIRNKVRSLLIRAPNRKISANRLAAVTLDTSASSNPASLGRIGVASSPSPTNIRHGTSSAHLRAAERVEPPNLLDARTAPSPFSSSEGISSAADSRELLELIVSLTGLSELVARSSVETACRRLSLDPRTLSKRDIPKVVESLERTLQLFLPEREAKRRLAAITALAR